MPLLSVSRKRKRSIPNLTVSPQMASCLIQCVRLNLENRCKRCVEKDLPCSVPMLPNGAVSDSKIFFELDLNIAQNATGNAPGSSLCFSLQLGVSDVSMHSTPTQSAQSNLLEEDIKELQEPTEPPHLLHVIRHRVEDHEERYHFQLEKSIVLSSTSSNSSFRRVKMSGLLR